MLRGNKTNKTQGILKNILDARQSRSIAIEGQVKDSSPFIGIFNYVKSLVLLNIDVWVSRVVVPIPTLPGIESGLINRPIQPRT